MKRVVLLFAFLIAMSSVVFSQSSLSYQFSSEIGPAFTGTGDMLGVVFSDELLVQVGNHIAVGTALELQNFSERSLLIDNFDTRNYYNLGLNLYYTKNLGSLFNFYAGLGVLARKTRGTNFSGYYNILDDSGEQHTIYTFYKDDYFAFGYTAVLGLGIKLSDRLEIPIKIYLQNDNHQDITESLRTGLCYTF